MADSALQIRMEGAIAHLTLNAPPKNETDAAFFDALAEFCGKLLPGLDAQGLVVSGAGRHFSSGADVDELKALVAARGANGDAIEHLSRHADLYSAIEALPFPVVAAVSGTCFGSGLELALSCHHRVAARRAVFSLPETGFGLMPGCGGTVRLPRLVGTGKAVEMILSGRPLLADEALAAGLVDRVVDRNDLIPAAETLVRRLNP